MFGRENRSRIVLVWLLPCMFDTVSAPTAQDKRRQFSDGLSKLRKTIWEDMLNGTLSIRVGSTTVHAAWLQNQQGALGILV